MTSSSSSSPPPRNLQITTTATANNKSASSSSSGLTHHHLSPSSSTRPFRVASGSGAGQNQACAACKYQRRKCNPDCALARYFPADKQNRFLRAHKLFGVGNIQRTLRETPPDLRNDAMRALIYHAEARAYDPIGGCCRLVLDHEKELNIAMAELKALRFHLEACRRHQAGGEQLLDNGEGMMLLVGAGPHASDVPVDALFAAGQEIDYGQASGEHYLLGAAADMAAQPHQMCDYFCYDGPAGDETSSHAWSNADNNNNMLQQHYRGNGILKAGSPVPSLGDDQTEAQFVDVFDVKPDIAVATAVVMEHDAGSGDDSFEHQLEEKVVATVVKHELLDQAESSAAVSRCQLELGFSSF